MRRILALAVALLVAMPLPAHAYVPEQTPRRDAEARGRTALADRRARGIPAGLIVMRGGKVIAGINADRAMTPASLMKLATTTAAIARFGVAHRFATRVLVPRGSGSTPSTLYMVGGGDPTLATDAYRRHRYLPKPTDIVKVPAFASGSPTIEQLAARIATSGVSVVRGNLIADESLFDGSRTQPGWISRYLRDEPDTGLLSALVVNEGRGDLEGDIVVPSPASSAGQALRKALAARGVTVTGSVRVGRAPPGAVEVARVESPPVSQLVDFVNRYSINMAAEMLLKGLGARFGGAGTTEAGVRVVTETLGDLGVPLEGFHMADGSGLSLHNTISPRTIASIVNVILTRVGPEWDVIRASLPIAGRPGTLFRRMREKPVAGNLRGKTGSLRSVRALAGWVTARDGVPVVYAMIFNRAPNSFALAAPLDLFGLLLSLYRT